MLDATPIDPAALVGALAPAKAYLRIETDDEDAVLASLIATATRLCEQFCGQAMIVRTMTETLGVTGDWRRLARTPVVAITGVEGLPADGAPFALAVDAYAIDIDRNGDGWVRVARPGAAGRVRVTYAAGIAADWDGLDDPIRQGSSGWSRTCTRIAMAPTGAATGGSGGAVAALATDAAGMSRELAGLLRERVTIERRAAGRDALAGANGGWTALATLWAGVVPDGVDPAVAAGARDAMPRWTVTLRAGADVLPGDRLLWGDRVLAVTSIETWPDRLRIRAREQR